MYPNIYTYMAWYLFQFKKIEKVVVIILHDLAYSLLMYFYFARFKEWIITIYSHSMPISLSQALSDGDVLDSYYESRSIEVHPSGPDVNLRSVLHIIVLYIIESIIHKKPTSLQITPATIFVPLLDFFLQVLPLIFQLFKRIRAMFQKSPSKTVHLDSKHALIP